LKIQTKRHRWSGDPHRRFDDLYNLVHDPAFLVVALDRVRNNKGPGRREWTDRRPAPLRPGAVWGPSWTICGLTELTFAERPRRRTG
jgi:hypothetical protein